MAKTSQTNADDEKGVGEPSTLALIANGSSGRWSVTLDETTEDTEEWFLQIEGPSLSLFCEVEDPEILHILAASLNEPIKKLDVLVIGRVNRIPLRLQWDVTDDTVLFFTVGPASRPLVRYSIHGRDIRDLADAIQQAALDL